MKVTGPDGYNPITDEQIRDLAIVLCKELDSKVLIPNHHQRITNELAGTYEQTWEEVRDEWIATMEALGRVRNSRRAKGYRAAARTRCADAYNARFGGGS